MTGLWPTHSRTTTVATTPNRFPGKLDVAGVEDEQRTLEEDITGKVWNVVGQFLQADELLWACWWGFIREKCHVPGKVILSVELPPDINQIVRDETVFPPCSRDAM